MREHSKAFWKLSEYLKIIIIDKHCLLKAPALVVFSGDIFELTKLQEEICPIARFLELLSHDSPIFEALSEFEPRELNFDKLDVTLEFF